MSTDPGADPTGGAQFNRPMYVPRARPTKAYLIEEPGYLRLQGRIQKEMGRGDASIWLAVAFTFVGVALSTFVTWIVTPEHVAGLPSDTRNSIAIVAVAATVITLICALAYFGARKRSKDAAIDICSEMDTYSAKS
jgi:hypothetical protein